MDYFNYRHGQLFAEEVSLTALAEEVGTPFYCYSHATLERHYRVFSEAFTGIDAKICFAVKANSNIAVLRTLGRLGCGADAVSEGEIRRALAAGIPPADIVFSGVGKTQDEMAYALERDIFQINVESEPELLALNEVANRLGKKARIAIRVNPDVEAGTHAKISTGKKENKFGISMETALEVFNRARLLSGIEIRGVSIHIGSQLTSLAPFGEAFRRVESFVQALRQNGHTISVVDLGGGLGIPYHEGQEAPPIPVEYARLARQTAENLRCQLVLEPGRLICGNAGILVSQVIYVKENGGRTFVIVDAAMNDLLRPTLYSAYHAIAPVKEPLPGTPVQPVDVVGPVCETGDTFAEQRPLVVPESGDLLVFRSAGAYGAVMSSTYNTRPLVPEVLVSGEKFSVIRKRQTYEELLAAESIPDWLK
jgi:diaminopimelate decarboxylase